MDLDSSDRSRRHAACAGWYVCTQGATAKSAVAQTKGKIRIKSHIHKYHPCS